jgi:type I restriction enzyme M protein
MLDKPTKTIINNARDILVGKVPNPQSQVDLITIAMIYKFMDDMDKQNMELGGNRVFFTDDLEQYAWSKLLAPKHNNWDRLALYSEALDKLQIAKQIPELFRKIFKGAFLPFRDGATLTMFLKEIDYFSYDNSENLGNAFEYLLSIMGSQGDAGQFRTPRHIIDFIVDVVNPTKTDTILDPACGTAGFLISAYKHILEQAKKANKPLTPTQMKTLTDNIVGYDISPDMVKLASVNLFLHQFPTPKIYEYDTLSSDDRWGDKFDVILANPPFMTPRGGILPHSKFGIKANRAEVLFVDYMMEHLNLKGKAGFVVPEGIIFQSATAYKELRKMMVEDNYLYAVVSLPSGVFNPYSGVKTSILLFDRELAKKTKDILFVKVDNDGYDLGAQRREIKDNDLPDALKLLQLWQKSIGTETTPEELTKSKKITIISKEKLAEDGEYNLSASRYQKAPDFSNCQYEMVKLGDVCELVRGVTYSKDNEVDKSDTIVLRANNISLETNSLDLTELKYLNDQYSFDEAKQLQKGDIFICLASGSKQHIGKVAFIDRDTKYLFGGFMGAIRSNSKIHSKYLFNMLASDHFREYLCSQITGVNINNLNQKILYNYEIPLLPLSVQEEIVTELDQYQAIIDGAQKVIDNWKPTIEINPAWEKVKIGDVCRLVNGIAFKPDDWESQENGGLPIVRIQNLNNKDAEFNYSSKKIRDDFLIENGQLLFSWSGSRGTSFGPHIWRGNKAILNQHIFKVLFDDKLYLKHFLYLALKIIVSQVENTLHGGVGLVHITKGNLENIKIYKPSLEEQKTIVAQIEQEEKYVDACKKLIEINKQKISDKIKSIWNCGNE